MPCGFLYSEIYRAEDILYLMFLIAATALDQTRIRRVLVPRAFGLKEESCIYTVLACSMKLLSVLLCWLTISTKRLVPSRGAVSTNCVHVQYEISMYTAICAVSPNGVNSRVRVRSETRSTIERGRGCNKIVPVLRGNGTKIAPTGDICVQPPGEVSWIRGKLADHVGDHAVLSPEEVVLAISSGTELSHPRPSQSLNNS